MFFKFKLTNGANFAPANAPKGALIGMQETITTVTGATANTLAAADYARNLLLCSGSTTSTVVTTPTASELVSSITFCDNGDTYRQRIKNSGTGPVVITGGTGVTVVDGTINASSVKEFLISLEGTAPSVICTTAITTNASKVITGFTEAQTAAIKIGMLVTGTNAGASAKVVGIQPGTGVTVDVNSSGTSTPASPVTLTLAPAVTVTGLGQGLL